MRNTFSRMFGKSTVEPSVTFHIFLKNNLEGDNKDDTAESPELLKGTIPLLLPSNSCF